MTYDPYREGRRDDIPPTRPMIADGPPEGGRWIAVAVIAAVLVAAGYFYLRPDMPSPVMRAEPPSVTTPSPD